MRKKYIVRKECEGCSIREFLLKEIHLSQKQMRTLKFRENGILRNSQRAYVKDVLSEGDVIELAIDDGARSSCHLIPLKGEINILYEDTDVICLWKKTGMVVHPSGGHYQDSLSNLLQAYLLEKGERLVIRSIGRIDSDTEGVVVFAKNKIAAARLWKQLENGKMKKEYLALCEGDFSNEEFEKEQTIRLSIGSLRETNQKEITLNTMQEMCNYKMCISQGGKNAVTHYQAIGRYETGTLVKFWLETGRTHQIRVHMSYLKHPLVGDPIYGSGELGKDHTLLCAWKVHFFQPFTGNLIECQSDIPFLPNVSKVHPK